MAGHTDNAVVVNAPLNVLWEMTNDVAGWPELFPEYAVAEVLAYGDGWVRFRLTTRPDEQGRVWSWVSERKADPTTRTVNAHRVETGPFEYMQLWWQYTEVENGVRMRWVQNFEMKPSAPFDDLEMTEYLNRNTVKQMAHIKERVEETARAQVSRSRRR